MITKKGHLYLSSRLGNSKDLRSSVLEMDKDQIYISLCYHTEPVYKPLCPCLLK